MYLPYFSCLLAKEVYLAPWRLHTRSLTGCHGQQGRIGGRGGPCILPLLPETTISY
jgi:hypothetical protein